MEDNSQGKRAQTTERKGLVMCTEWRACIGGQMH